MKLGIGLNIHNKKIGSGLSASYKSVLAYATTNAYTVPSADVQTIQNNLLSTLEDLGIISNLDYLYLFANNGYDSFARINVANPAKHYCLKYNDILLNDKLGYTVDPGGSTGGYMDPQYINRPSPTGDAVHSSQNDAIIGVYVTSLPPGLLMTHHVSSAQGGNRFYIRQSTDQYIMNIWTSQSATTITSAIPGLYYGIRTSSNTTSQYYNDTNIDTTTQVSNNYGTGTLPAHVFFQNSLTNQTTSVYKGGYTGLAFSGKGSVFIGKTSDFNTAVQTYFTALNAL